ncbi:MAG: sirohydrochlorin cobaltochelatase [Vallitalea sp.]|jgi:sirohydrochlorin cobaltochelatase|nr:sirohydrochlorin cobaltochelatase [Vallitalea sp.]
MTYKYILLVSYGCSSKNQLDKIIINVANELQERYPKYKVDYAFLSSFMRDLLIKKENIKVDLLNEKIEQLNYMGVKEIIIQPILMVPGSEFLKIENCCSTYRNIKFKIGKTLLHDKTTFDETYSLIEDYINKDISDNTGIVFMGHGTNDFAQDKYNDYARYISNKNNYVYLGTLEAKPDIDDILVRLERANINIVHLYPFLIGCGAHTLKDMLGDNNYSWKYKLEKAGIKVLGHQKGLSDHIFYNKLLINKIKKLI